ncbi:cell division cycle protein 16 homolog isoform X2 [Littorina saxatilis]|uniref:Cell division cycle protein 16 homolog n=1 Tax=Littorina saxatilis TaxID=31220 RepID=A0AAN9G0K9_9CAEN
MAGESGCQVPESQTKGKLNLDRLKEIVKKYIDKHHYESALFWADKIVSLSGGAVEDIYWYAQTLYHTGQYHRAATLLCSRKLDRHYAACRFLAAKCHFECKEWQEALNILDMAEVSLTKPSFLQSSINQLSMDADDSLPIRGIESSISLLRGRIYEAMDNRGLAADCFRRALQQDVYCFEAFDLLVSHHMMSAQEEQDLLKTLPLVAQCPEDEMELVRFLYQNRLKKYDKPGTHSIPQSLSPLLENVDVVVNLAERRYYNCEFQKCHKITSGVLSKDPYNSRCLPLHVAVLVELKKPNALFYLGHKLVDFYPNKPVSWFAVGCYYLLTKNFEPARRYLSKATTLEKTFGPAWLAYGHSFAADNEHDQAMAAYFTASQIMKGCHLPVLYIGLEYGLTSNAKLAERFFTLAQSIAPDDPFVLHEMGVIAFQNHEWVEAERYFKEALSRIQSVGYQHMPEKWEALLNNLGHVSRKLKKYEEALEYHRQAELLCPQNPSTYSAIAYIHALTGNNSLAVDFFHKALGLRRDDAFSTTMLGHVIEALMSEVPPIVGDDDSDSLNTSASVVLPPFRPLSFSQADTDDSSLAAHPGDNSSMMAIEEVEMDG